MSEEARKRRRTNQSTRKRSLSGLKKVSAMSWAKSQQQDQSDYLFQLNPGAQNILVFNILPREVTKTTPKFEISQYAGFYHFNSDLYLARGRLSSNFIRNFKRISSRGEVWDL